MTSSPADATLSDAEKEKIGNRVEQLFQRLDGGGLTDNEIVSNVHLLKENLCKLGLDFNTVVAMAGNSGAGNADEQTRLLKQTLEETLKANESLKTAEQLALRKMERMSNSVAPVREENERLREYERRENERLEEFRKTNAAIRAAEQAALYKAAQANESIAPVRKEIEFLKDENDALRHKISAKFNSLTKFSVPLPPSWEDREAIGALCRGEEASLTRLINYICPYLDENQVHDFAFHVPGQGKGIVLGIAGTHDYVRHASFSQNVHDHNEIYAEYFDPQSSADVLAITYAHGIPDVDKFLSATIVLERQTGNHPAATNDMVRIRTITDKGWKNRNQFKANAFNEQIARFYLLSLAEQVPLLQKEAARNARDAHVSHYDAHPFPVGRNSQLGLDKPHLTYRATPPDPVVSVVAPAPESPPWGTWFRKLMTRGHN